MQLRYYTSDRHLPGLLMSVLLWLCIPCNAGPTLVSAISTTAADFKLSVSALGLPQFKRLTLTFTYDPSAMDPLNAIVSSPIPSAALGAVLDTSVRKIVLYIIATSTITVADGARVSTISAPLLQSGAAQNALWLIGALCIDQDSVQTNLSILDQSAAIKHPFNGAPLSAAGRPQLPGKYICLTEGSAPQTDAGPFLWAKAAVAAWYF